MMDRTKVIHKVLITGATGSGARYLIEYLQEHQPQVTIHGTARRKNSKKNPTGIELHEVDLLDSMSILRCLSQVRPDVIFHLAANPDKGFEVPSAILMNNAVGSANLFEAIRYYNDYRSITVNLPIIINVSSSEVYGAVKPEEVPITEECPKRPVSPYAVAKLAQDNLGSVYFKAYGMPVITTRSFSYNNFHRLNLFTSDFARQIALVEAGKLKVVKHGNLDSVRVMCDARDIARAYWLCATKCEPGEAYNIGGGQQVTVGRVLDHLIRISQERPESLPIEIEQDPALMRPVDVTLQVPDCGKFKKATGWEPKFDLDQSLNDLLNHWRKEVQKEF